jgi:DNA helicase II / ATP-dependent DNA helicase PcrA
VHLPHLVDGAVPSDMALGSPEGLAEERRLFYVAVTRARDELYLYAPLRLHIHRGIRDDRHGYAQISRFLNAGAQAQCEIVEAAPREPVVPRMAQLATTVDAALESLWSG